MNQLWQEALEQLRERLGNQNFETWIRPIRAQNSNHGELILEVPNKFFRDWVVEHFLPQIRESLTALSDHPVKVSLSVNQQLEFSKPAERKNGKKVTNRVIHSCG